MRHFINVTKIDKYELVDGTALIDRDFHIVTANESMYQFMGISKNYDIVDVIHPVDLDDFINVSNTLLVGDDSSLVIRMRRVDNSYRWMYVKISKIEIDYDNIKEEVLQLEISDVSAIERERKNLKTQENLFKLILSAEGESLFTYDHLSDEFVVYRYVDDEAVSMFNGSLGKMRDFFLNCSPQKNTVNEFFDTILSNKSHFKFNFYSNLINGDMYEPVEVIASSQFKNGKKSTTAGSIRNLSENGTYSIFTYRNEGRGELLTEEEVHNYVRRNIATNSDVAITMALFQIDNYDGIINQLGVERADQMFNEICIYLQDEIGNRGVIGYYDDHTIFIAIKNLITDVNLRAFLESTRSMISWKIALMKYQCKLTFSIGVSRYPFNGRDYDIVSKKLYRALDLANSKGHNRYILYREHLHGEIE